MATVVITGWVTGFQKVECTKLVRLELGLSLVDGKRITDAILDKRLQRLEAASSEHAARLANELTNLGAIAHVEPDHR